MQTQKNSIFQFKAFFFCLKMHAHYMHHIMIYRYKLFRCFDMYKQPNQPVLHRAYAFNNTISLCTTEYRKHTVCNLCNSYECECVHKTDDMK